MRRGDEVTWLLMRRNGGIQVFVATAGRKDVSMFVTSGWVAKLHMRTTCALNLGDTQPRQGKAQDQANGPVHHVIVHA